MCVLPSRELGDSATVFQCHYDLGSLHLKERHPTLAVHCFEEALTVARSQRNVQFESETLREMGQVLMYCLHHFVGGGGGGGGVSIRKTVLMEVLSLCCVCYRDHFLK